MEQGEGVPGRSEHRCSWKEASWPDLTDSHRSTLKTSFYAKCTNHTKKKTVSGSQQMTGYTLKTLDNGVIRGRIHVSAFEMFFIKLEIKNINLERDALTRP